MSILTDRLPTQISGVQIAPDFRVMVCYEQLLFDKKLSPTKKICKALNAFYPKGIQTLSRDEAWRGLQWFYCMGKPDYQPKYGDGQKGERAYDFEIDASRIVAAFQQAYGIDLTAAKLHWWRFRALFENLPAECRLCKIMEYRVADTRDMPEKTKAFYRRMHDLYTLGRWVKEPMTVEQHDKAFINRLRRKA